MFRMEKFDVLHISNIQTFNALALPGGMPGAAD
jgi:hypothetical protein